MPTIDPHHEFVHKVPALQLDSYMDYWRSSVTSVCGKTWSPERPSMDLSKPRCPACFPKPPKFAIAA